MKRKEKWRKTIALILCALMATQLPGIAKAGTKLFTPTDYSVVGYMPLIQNAPSPTPTNTPAPTATFTPTPTTAPLPAGTPPAYSTSYYLLTVDGNKMYNLGCQLGTQDRDKAGSRDQILVLDFGSPKKIGSEYGTDLFWMGPVTNTQIKSAVENFGRGYYICASTDRASQIYIVVGTTNYGSLMASSTATARALGVAWAQMINDTNAWFVSNGYSSQVHALGGNDIELAWNSASVTRAWVDGYDSVDKYNYYDFGAADGCPTRSNPNSTTCANGWTVEDAWYKTYGTRPGFPLPEIYNTRGANAEQWALLSLYSVNKHGYKIEFHGVLTQWQACKQVDASECAGVNNTPATGWLQLYNELKRDTRTFYTPRWSTDILWAFTMPSGPLASAGDSGQSSDLPTLAQQSVDSLSAALQQNGLDAQMRVNLQGKLENAQRLLADTAYGQLHPAPKSFSKSPQTAPVTDSNFPVGIFEGAGGVIHTWEANIINHWQDRLGSDYWLVSAGALAEDPNQGVVVVMRVTADRTSYSRQIVRSPQKTGALRVVSASGSELVLASERGNQFHFNPTTGQFNP